MTDNEIIKALECCSQSGDFTKTQDEICSPCPYFNYGDCTGELKADALDLISRQKADLIDKEKQLQEALKSMAVNKTKVIDCEKEIDCQKAEIERLTIRLRKAEHQLDDAMKMYNIIKAEAYKECMARVEDRLSHRLDPELYPYIKDVLHNELEKMVGGSNEKT